MKIFNKNSTEITIIFAALLLFGTTGVIVALAEGPNEVSPPALTGISAETSAVISWTTDTLSDSQVEYGETASYGLSSELLDVSVPVTFHSVTLSSLSPNTTYHYRVKSRDAQGNEAVSSDLILTTSRLPASPVPPAPSVAPVTGVSSGSIDSTSAVISWTTGKLVNSTVEYGTTTSYGSLSLWQGASVPATTHSFLLSSLTPSTTYHYRIQTSDAEGNANASSGYTFTTLPAQPTSPVVPPPVVTDIFASNITAASAAISWTTNEPSNSQVEYGTTTSYGLVSQLLDVSSATTSHTIALSSLTPNTTYHYNVKSRNTKGHLAVSPDLTFSTLVKIPAPTQALTDIFSSEITEASALISWTVNILPDSNGGYEKTSSYRSHSRVEYGQTKNYGLASVWQGASQGDLVITNPLSASLPQLSPSTMYHYRIRNIDVKGKSVFSPDFTFTTRALAGKTALFDVVLEVAGSTPQRRSLFIILSLIAAILVLALVLFVLKKNK